MNRMNRDKKILLSLVILLICMALIIGGLVIMGGKHEVSDSKRFKEEYEAYNGKVDEKNQVNYPDVSIPLENPIRYMTDDEVVRFMEKGTGLIYFGFANSPACRLTIPLLLQAATSTNLSEIIYVDVSSIRKQLILDDNDEVVVTQEGSNGYLSILQKLDAYLPSYELKNKQGEVIDAHEKRLYAPTIVSIFEGQILDVYVGKLPNQDSSYTFSEEEEKTLFDTYQKMMLGLLNSTCDDAC